MCQELRCDWTPCRSNVRRSSCSIHIYRSLSYLSEWPEVEEIVWVLAVTISLPVTSSLGVDIILLLTRRTCLLRYHVLIYSSRTEQYKSVSKTLSSTSGTPVPERVCHSGMSDTYNGTVSGFSCAAICDRTEISCQGSLDSPGLPPSQHLLHI